MNKLARRARFCSDKHLDERARILAALDLTEEALRNGVIMPGEALEIVASLKATNAASLDLQHDLDAFTAYLNSLPREAVAMLPHEPLPRDLVLEGMQMTLAFQPAARRESAVATMRQREVASA